MQDRLWETTVSELMNLVLQYRRGNTALLDALMSTCWNTPDAEAKVRQVLRDAKMLTEDGPDWAGLEQRKAQQWTWEEAVCYLCKDPAERDRLLKLQDNVPADAVVIRDTFPSIQDAARYLADLAASRGQSIVMVR